MKLLEVVIGFFLLAFIFGIAMNFLFISNQKVDTYSKKIQNDSKKISLYNYSNKLIENTNKATSGYIYLSGNNFLTGSKGDFFYNCKKENKKLLKTNIKKDFIFCKIESRNENFYNYKLLKN